MTKLQPSHTTRNRAKFITVILLCMGWFSVFGLIQTVSSLPTNGGIEVCQAQDAPATPAVTTPAANKVSRNAAGQPLVTNVFSETDIRQVLSDIGVQTGMTIIADSTVQGTVSADLKDTSLEKALTMVLLPGGFTYAKLDDYYLVGAPDPTNPNYYLLCSTEVINLKHVDAQMVISMLQGTYGKYISAEGIPSKTTDRGNTRSGGLTTATNVISTGSQSAPPQSYRITVTAPKSLIERIKMDIIQIDQPQQQVMIEASVVEISENTLRSLGVDWATKWFRQDLTSGGPNLIYSTVANTELAALTALTTSGRATVRANPRIATANGQTAEIEVGKENYFAIISGPVSYPYTTLEKITSGILFRITPRILQPENEIIADIQPEVRDVTGRGTNGLPEITFRTARTNLRVKDGQSIVIGGLVNEFNLKETRKTPILGDIPLIGAIFTRTDNRRTRNEVVIIITPHILTGTGSGTPAKLTRAERLRREISQESDDSETN